MLELSDLIHFMKTHEIIDFILPGCGHTAFATVAFTDVIKQLESINKQTEKEQK